MGKMNQKFMEESGSGFTQDTEDFLDDDYHYEKWLGELKKSRRTSYRYFKNSTRPRDTS